MKKEALSFCPYCGGKLDEDAIFCVFCGAKLDEEAPESTAERQRLKERLSVNPDSGRLCPACGGRLNEDSLFCDFCGSRVDQTLSAPSQEQENTNRIHPTSKVDAPAHAGRTSEQSKLQDLDLKPPGSSPEFKENSETSTADRFEVPQNISKPSTTFSFGIPRVEQAHGMQKQDGFVTQTENKLPKTEKTGITGEMAVNRFDRKTPPPIPEQGKAPTASHPEREYENKPILKLEKIADHTPNARRDNKNHDERPKKALTPGLIAGIALCLVFVAILFLTGLIKLPQKAAAVPDTYNDAEQSAHMNAHGYYTGESDLSEIEAENQLPTEAFSGGQENAAGYPYEERIEPAASQEDTSLHFPYSGKIFYADADTWLPECYGIDVVELLEPESARASAVFSSSNPSVAKVDQNGKVWFVNEGTAVITATEGKETAGFTVEVVFNFAQLDCKQVLGKAPPDLVENTYLYYKVKPDSVSASSEITQSSSNSRFDALMAVDGDINTSWQENAFDDGKGEWICLNYDSPVSVSAVAIWPGYWKSDYLFEGNAKPRSLMILFDSGTCVISELENSMKCLTVTLSQPVETSSVCVKVLETWSGTVWNDLAISEIAVYSHTD